MKKITFLIVLAALLSGSYGTAQITTYPYSEDFEAGAGGWVATNGANGTWALGAPTANVINSAASGANAWATNLSGNYNNNDNSFVQSPVFDLSSLTAPSIQFSVWWNSEFSWDGMVLQSSINGGTTWQNVGAFGDPNNWYNDNSINGAPGGQPAATAQGWTGRVSSNNGSNGWRLARHALTGLAGQSNVVFRFAFGSDGSVQDNGVAFDLVSVVDVLCPAPSALTATNLSLTSTQLSWTENGGATLYNVEYGPSGFTQGTGTNVTSVGNPYTITDLMADTLYQFYVQADCGANGLSFWSGPTSFFTGYCVSVPSSNDGQGVTNVTIGVTDFPSFGDVTYENHTATPVNAFQGIETNVSIAFATGFTYDANIWIDFNDNLVFEASEIVFQGTSAAPNPSTLNATFTMPVTAPVGQHRMRIGTADFGQTTPNPCYNGSFGVTLDFTINILILDCVLPAAEYTAVPDCTGNQFFIEVNVTSLGDATSLELSNSLNTDTTQALATGVYPIGPFAFGSTVRVFVTSEQNSNCVIASPNFSILACPPLNDGCATATVAVVNPGGTCDNTTPGTVLAATPSGVPAGTCAGNPDDDVWFQFTALNEVQSISLINITGGTTNLDHAVYTGSCGALTELYCSPNSSSFTPLLTVGTTYFIRVFSGGSIPETSSFDLCIQKAPENTICEQAANFCSAGGTSVGPNITGITNNSSIACLGSAPNPSWNIIQIGQAGLIEIEIAQTSSATGAGIDVDFVLWGPFDTDTDFCSLGLEVDCPTCPNNTTSPNFYPFGNIVDCSYDAASIENLTIDNAQAGEIYVLLVTNFANQPGNISITQTNTGGGTTVATIQVDLGGDQELCGTDSLVLSANSPFADTYEWYADGFIIEGETDPTLTVTESNTYTVIVYDSQCDVTAQDAVTITLGLEPVANAVPNIVTCDDISGDGFEEFNLESQTAAILGTQDPTLFNVTYHLSQSDAITNTGALASPYTNISNPQQIWVRIEDANAAFCIATTSFSLVVSGATPTATSIDLEVCDDLSGDGIASFTLTANDLNVLNGQNPADYSVTYYATQADADAATNPLTSPYTNTTNPQTIWARVDNNAAVDCYATASFDLIVSPLPTANASPDVAGCDTDDNGIAEYDLTENEGVITGEEAGLTVSYYTTMADANTGTAPIGVPTNYETTLTTIYVRVDDTATSCFNVTSLDLVAGELPMTAFATNIAFEVCPNATSPITVTAIPQNYTAADVSIRWYEDGVLISGASSLTLPVLTAGFYEIEVTFNTTGCTDIIGQQIIELPSCIIPQGISPNGDGQNETFDLSSFNVVRIEIFNRLGRMVYSKDNYTNEWFGQTNNGDELPVGTYFYTMIYEGGAKTKSSWVYINK